MSEASSRRSRSESALQEHKEYWVLQRRSLPHGQAIHNSMESETKAETDLHVTWAHEKLAGMFATQGRHEEAEAVYE